MEMVVHGQPTEKEKEEKSKYGKYDEYEIKECARTLVKAEEIKADKDKMKYVAMCLKEKKKALDRVPINNLDDLKKRAKDVASADKGNSYSDY